MGRWIEEHKRARRLLQQLINEQNHRCCYCGVQMVTNSSKKNSRVYATLEHVNAKKHYRETRNRYHDDHLAWENCVAACKQCNNRRGQIDAFLFMERELWKSTNKHLLAIHVAMDAFKEHGSMKTLKRMSSFCRCEK